ncbi:MFS transporter [Pedobacter cryoconitis]|uniref:EmrB/QacA subfamily drug resistance transporter n=1 Tax=Pedobacter cryoconitis TaxID=188932 RepID=A0A7X0MHJ2_9SPHI|nr:MFS transporter [Pedobacter cryoconitis]MBB6499412.1 EmrB/QacA subfamily drug resistance transporter [Pedobacter cryoconitis]
MQKVVPDSLSAHTINPYPKRWLALIVLLMGAFLSPLDFFIVNVALPAIKDGLHASSTQLQFVIIAYGSTYAVLVVTGGRLGDIYGRKRIFIIGMLLFTLSSAVCGLAPNIMILIGARIVQGLAAAVLAPQVLSSIRIIFPVNEQPKAMGFFGATFGLASIAGQLLGGVLIKVQPLGFTWESVFMINIPLGLLTILLAFFILPENKPAKKPKLDIPGILLLSLALFLIIYPLIKGREEGWPLWIFLCFAAAIPVLIAFVHTERHTIKKGRDPLIDLSLFQNQHFVTGTIIIFFFNSTAAFFMVYPYYLQNGLHWDVLSAGLAVLPYAAGFFIGPLTSTLLTRKIGSGVVLLALGLLALGFGLTILSVLLYHTPGTIMYAGLMIAGMGHGIVLPSLVRITLAPVTHEKAGMAAGVVSTAIQMGSAIGVAIIGTIFFSVLNGQTFKTAFAIAMGCLLCIFIIAFFLTIRLNSLPVKK